MLKERHCRFCGAKLPSNRRSYCSAECAEKALKQMYWEKQDEKRLNKPPEITDVRTLKMPCGCEFFRENSRIVKTKWCLKHSKSNQELKIDS